MEKLVVIQCLGKTSTTMCLKVYEIWLQEEYTSYCVFCEVAYLLIHAAVVYVA
jgi:hypothetical protein